MYSTSVITKLASSVVLAERYEGSLALRAFHDKVTERDTSKPSEGKTKKLCFGCYKPECTETRFTCPVYLAKQNQGKAGREKRARESKGFKREFELDGKKYRVEGSKLVPA